MSAMDKKPFPREALIGAALLLEICVGGVAALQVRKHLDQSAPPPPVAALQTRQLRFVDAGDGVNAYGGHVRVFDAVTGRELPELRPNDGFVRAVLNSLAFERSRDGADGQPVFTLALYPGNRMTMEDALTGKHVVLNAFGHGNKEVFVRFLEHPEGKS
jgi:putative photosynthetic complex assembly protein